MFPGLTDGVGAENFSEEAQRFAIKDSSELYTACDDGKTPFVSAADITAVASRALTDKKPHNNGYRILGPELLTYDEMSYHQPDRKSQLEYQH